MLETGVDIIEIGRVEAAIARYGDRFLERVFTRGEVEQCRGKAESLAARFAAKEAVSKYQVAKDTGDVPFPEPGGQAGPEQSPAS